MGGWLRNSWAVIGSMNICVDGGGGERSEAKVEENEEEEEWEITFWLASSMIVDHLELKDRDPKSFKSSPDCLFGTVIALRNRYLFCIIR